MQYRHGLLYSVFDGVFNNTEKPLQIPQETCKDWARVQQHCVQIHADLGLEIKMMQDVFSNRAQPHNTVLARALQVGQVYEAMINDPKASAFVKVIRSASVEYIMRVCTGHRSTASLGDATNERIAICRQIPQHFD
jgi:hypothetical protein